MIHLTHAPKGGITIYDRFYKGGELLPFYVPRPLMPQIDEENYHEFVEFTIDRAVPLWMETTDPSGLRAHQRIDRIKAERMSEDILAKPIIVSNDAFILDGNHRWLAHIVFNNHAIDTMRLGLPFDEAIAFMFTFPKTYALAHHVEAN